MSAPAVPLLGELAPPGAKNVSVRLKKLAEREVRRGHPWIFSGSISHESHEGAPGDLAVLYNKDRDLVGLGLFDPRSPIRVKMLHVGASVPIDEAFFQQRLEKAAHKRRKLGRSDTDGYRVVHGENDGMPGLVVDRYAHTLVMKLYSPAWVPWLPRVIPPLLDVVPCERLVLRVSRGMKKHPGDLPSPLRGDAGAVALLGPEGPYAVRFRENALTFEADPFRGQKTGFFLDQRDNRARVGALSAEKRVLNAFAYSGGFSLYAARAGARAVVSLDVSAPALEAAVHHFALNRASPAVAACDHQILCRDAFEAMESLAAEGRRFDVVVIDPPSFATRQEHIGRALAAYARLCRLGLAVLEEGGHLVLASCSSRVTAAQFRENAERTAERAGRPLTLVEETGHALDHPIAFPEGAYLKCLFTRA